MIPKVTKADVDAKTEEVAQLDAATQHALHSIRKSNRRFSVSAYILLVLILVGVGLGLYYQNNLATLNKQHIDCIVKLLATPQKPGTTHKFISNASQTCNIRFN